MSMKTSSLAFRMMTLCFAVRDSIWPVEHKLQGKGIHPGHVVLDYGVRSRQLFFCRSSTRRRIGYGVRCRCESARG